MKTTFQTLLDEYNGGNTADSLTINLRELVSRVLTNGKAGEISINLKIKPVKGAETQVEIEAVCKHKMPTLKGDKSETTVDASVMHATVEGDLSYVQTPAFEIAKAI